MNQKSWTIKELLKITADYLKKKQIDSPRLTAEILLAHQLQTDRIYLYLNFDQPLTESEISGYRSFIRRRVAHEPVQYITGVQEFRSLEFMVDSHVLIPRPETELLVELAASRLKKQAGLMNCPPMVLDLGTGCGAIAISLAKEFQQVLFWAADISAEAIKLAKLNAKKHGVLNKIEFLQGDLLKPLLNKGLSFDIILSNPPYIASYEYIDLPPEVRDYEPCISLDGGEDGMLFIERIIMEAHNFMNPGGWLMLEMAPGQTAKAIMLAEKMSVYGKKERIRDLSHNYRVVILQKV